MACDLLTCVILEHQYRPNPQDFYPLHFINERSVTDRNIVDPNDVHMTKRSRDCPHSHMFFSNTKRFFKFGVSSLPNIIKIDAFYLHKKGITNSTDFIDKYLLNIKQGTAVIKEHELVIKTR